MEETPQFLDWNKPIPVGVWRVAMFVFNDRVMQGYGDEYVANYITYWGARVGLDVSKNHIVKGAYKVQLGADPATPWFVYVRNTVKGLTSVEVFKTTKMLVWFFEQATEGWMANYLETAQGHLGAGIRQANPPQWATSDSFLLAERWYGVATIWKDVAPNPNLIEDKLQKMGLDIWSGPGGVVYKDDNPRVMILSLYTGDKPRRVGDIQKAIGAKALVVDLNHFEKNYTKDKSDKIYEASGAMLETIGDMAVGISEGLENATDLVPTVFDILGWIAKWGPFIAVGAVALYFGPRVLTAAKKSRGEWKKARAA